jgi:tetratricopeptide (TPR) repeat protein
MQSARLLQRELQYQADNIVGAIDRGSADVVAAVQKACDYLGGELCEVRWAIERQSQISQQILQVLLNALDNTSRQYWEQGVKCYETSEYDIARERFNRALDANRTNYFAYQYLGFIAVHEEKPSEAIKNFDLARKFADTGYHRALALSHLARGQYATGDLPHALQSAVAATNAAPEHAKFWYECAVFHVRGSSAEEAIRCLRQAIGGDWTYWSISISDASFEPIRKWVARLLEQMREEQRLSARQSLDAFGGTLRMLQGMGIAAEVAEWQKRLAECEASYREGTVFAYRNLVVPARDGQKQALQAAVKVLEQRSNANRSALSAAQKKQREAVSNAQSRINAVEHEAERKEKSYSASGFHGCLIAVAVLAGMAGCWMSVSGMPDRDQQVAGYVTAVAVVVGLIGLAWKPVMRFFTAEVPADNIRSQVLGLKRDLDRVKSESEAHLKEETAVLEGEPQLLKQHKEQCQQALSKI